MQYEVTEFAFELPDRWICERDADRFVCHGPHREEMIATATRVQGDPKDRGFATLVERLWSNALKSATVATAHPELIVTSPLAFDHKGTPFPLAMIRSRTRDGAVLFCVVAARGEQSVLLVTFEAPNDPDTNGAFDELVRTLRRV